MLICYPFTSLRLSTQNMAGRFGRAPMVGTYNVNNWRESFDNLVYKLEEAPGANLERHSGTNLKLFRYF